MRNRALPLLPYRTFIASAILAGSFFSNEPALADECSAPSFAERIRFGVGLLPNQPRNVSVADFNGDGKPDLAIAFVSSNTVSVLLGTGNGTFQTPLISYVGRSHHHGYGAVGDFNGDGKADLVLAFADNSGIVQVHLGNGDATFQTAGDYHVGGSPWSVAVGDFDGDGKPDVAVSNLTTDHAVAVLLGNGDGTLQAAVNYEVGALAYYVAVGDFNGDEKPDLVASNADPNVAVLLGNGDGTFQAAVNYGTGGASRPAVGDFNGDGKSDLAVGNNASGTVSVLLSKGDGSLQAAIAYVTGGNASSVAISDFNGDGKADLAVDNGISGTVSVLLGNGDGTFQTASNYLAQGWATSLAVGDFNGDGKPDLAVPTAGPTGAVSVLLNNCISAAPALTVVRGNAAVTVSWSISFTRFLLESTPSLSPANWQRPIEQPTTNNGRLEVILPHNQVERYLRLREP